MQAAALGEMWERCGGTRGVLGPGGGFPDELTLQLRPLGVRAGGCHTAGDRSSCAFLLFVCSLW